MSSWVQRRDFAESSLYDFLALPVLPAAAASAGALRQKANLKAVQWLRRSTVALPLRCSVAMRSKSQLAAAVEEVREAL